MKKFLIGFLAGILYMSLMGVLFLTGGTVLEPANWKNIGYIGENLKISAKLNQILNLLECYSLYDLEEKTLSDAAFKGLMEEIGDKYAVYYNKEEHESATNANNGTYTGIGVEITVGAFDCPEVVTVKEGMPAMEAGILPGDIMTEVNGEALAGLTLKEISGLLAENADCLITILRPVTAETEAESETETESEIRADGYEELVVEVQTTQIESVTAAGTMLDDTTGYIRIAAFRRATVEQFKQALKELEKEGMESLIIDIRDNPGGLLTSAVEMLDVLLPEGTVVYTMNRNGEKEESTSDAFALDIPLAVLINGSSASAAEIFAGAVRDFDRGILVGEKTFGKGIVQNTFTLADDSAVKFTVEYYYTPNGECIHGKGIEPDLAVQEGVESDDILIRAMEVLEEKEEPES